MPLAIPQIGSTFSPWSKSFLITGAMPGATLTVLSIGPASRAVAKGLAAGGADWLGLLPGETIRADDKFVVQQELSGVASNWTPTGKAYAPTPVPTLTSDLLPVQIVSRLWECGQHVFIEGAYPGTQIEFLAGSSTTVGDAPNGVARINFSNGLTAGSSVTARQVAPIGPGSPTVAPVEPLPFPPTVNFPAPVLKAPIRGCETAVFVSGVYEGATVRVKRTLHPEESAGFDLSGLWFNLGNPLKYDSPTTEYISVLQELPRCQRFGNESAPVPVGPPEALQPGIGPLCGDGTTVQLFNLQAGSIMHVTVGGLVYDLMAPRDVTSYSFDVDPPLVAGTTVSAVQEICGLTSVPGTRDVDVHPTVMEKPSLGEPLYNCARLVRVSNVHPGSEVQVFARTKTGEGPISLRRVFTSTYDEVKVIPHLNTDDYVWVVAEGCGAHLESDRKRVVDHPPIAAPRIEEKVVSGATSVTVQDVIPTASVFVYFLEGGTWKLIGSKTYAEAKATTVLLNRTLKTRDSVAASQYYCGQTTLRGPTTIVVKPPPAQPQILMPANGAANVSYLALTSNWKDPGAGLEQAAESYLFWLWESGKALPAAITLTTTSSTVAGPLHVGAFYHVRVVSRNSTGDSPPAEHSFSTLAPIPVLKSFDQTSMTLTGENFPPSMAVSVNVTHEIVGTIFVGDAPLSNDNRNKDLPATSDSTGKLAVTLDLYALLDLYDTLVISAGNTVKLLCRGPLKGENVILKAWYLTPKGKIESAPLKITWTKDNIVVLP